MKATYIASDLHLGVPTLQASLQRERNFIQWLQSIESDAEHLILLGDIFDFWFEYKHAIPKISPLLPAKLAEMRQKGINVEIFSGNHDIEYRDYFQNFLGVKVFHQPQERTLYGFPVFLAHGDGLGPGDWSYKLFKRILHLRITKGLLRWLHPDIGIPLAMRFSKTSRHLNQGHEEICYGEKELLYQFAKTYLERKNKDIRYFIFGHRHIARVMDLNGQSKILFVGDWLNHFSFVRIDRNGAQLRFWDKEAQK